MATDKLITMKQFNGTDYDTLYPKTKIEQVEGAYSSQQILSNATAAMFGLGDTAVPDEVLSFLGKYAQNIWKRRTYEVHYDAKLSSGVNQYCLGGGYKTTDSNTIYYSDEIELDSSGATVLKNEQSIDVSYSNRNDPVVQSLPGKYIRNAKQSLPSNASRPNEVLYVDPSATISGSTGDGSTRYGVYISAKGAKIATAYLRPIVGEWEYVYSANRNAYPDSGISGGYEYKYLGIPFDNAVNAAEIQPFSYVGTGTYGSGNPNSLTFDKPPKVIILISRYMSDGWYSACASEFDNAIANLANATTSYQKGSVFTPYYSSKYSYGKVSEDRKTVYWYSQYSADYQYNSADCTYSGIAIF